MKNYIDGVLTDMTADEISARETEIATNTQSYNERVTARNNEATAKATAQASGNTKLLDLGLTQAEATALTGYTPSED